jgi:hypothetical protein
MELLLRQCFNHRNAGFLKSNSDPIALAKLPYLCIAAAATALVICTAFHRMNLLTITRAGPATWSRTSLRLYVKSPTTGVGSLT